MDSYIVIYVIYLHTRTLHQINKILMLFKRKNTILIEEKQNTYQCIVRNSGKNVLCKHTTLENKQY